MNVKCPFCNFETTWPSRGRVLECDGECFSTYMLMLPRDDLNRVKMRLAEIFFLDEEYNLRASLEEVNEKCEFAAIPAGESGEQIVFGREFRPSLEEIEKLRESSEDETILVADMIERLDSSLDRFKRDLKGKASSTKLSADIKVVEALVSVIREKIESIK